MNGFIENNELQHNQILVDIINLREPGEILIPVYIKAKDKLYALTEMDDIGLDYIPRNLKICFGGIVNKFCKDPFDLTFLQYLFDTSYEVFELFDEKYHTPLTYVILETALLEPSFIPEKFNTVVMYINGIYTMIDNYCKNQYDLNKAKLINDK